MRSLEFIQIPVRICKTQSIKRDMLHLLRIFCIPAQVKDRIRLWNDNFCLPQIFSLSRDVIEHAARLVKIKLAR